MTNEIAVDGRNERKIKYGTVFTLFIVGSLLGVLIEGLWYLVDHGHWETHVVTIWGPFCIIYGFGMAGCYIGSVLLESRPLWQRFLVFSLIGATVEFLCGYTIMKGCGMRAWDYSGKFLDIMGLTDFNMAIVWGMIGVCFGFIVPWIDRTMAKLKGRAWKLFVALGSIWMAVNLIWTSCVIGRWASRHWGYPPLNSISEHIDRKYPDEYLESRYVEWWFLDEESPYVVK